LARFIHAKRCSEKGVSARPDGREQQRYLHANHPPGPALRMLHEIVRSGLEAQLLSAELDDVANIGTDGKRPRTSLLHGAVVGDGRVDLPVPSAVQIVAQLWLHIGLINAAPVMRASK